ncbi:hypothetical protein Dcar01_00659 [Deinococcus carri]|uniref:Uncharacterized protein n=1 Tax=Deinococcus carri TaxID=1211323 RepID=A0ABP9W574_9DEIO
MKEIPKSFPLRGRPLRFKLGLVALAVCALLYLSILVTLSLSLDAATKAGVIGTTVLAAEIFGLLGTAGVGKEVVQQLGQRLGFKKRKPGQL